MALFDRVFKMAKQDKTRRVSSTPQIQISRISEEDSVNRRHTDRSISRSTLAKEHSPHPSHTTLGSLQLSNLNLNLPQTSDKVYDKFLQKTLGRCLPTIIIDILEVEPVDPIYYIAMALKRAADTQRYYGALIEYHEQMVSCHEEMEFKLQDDRLRRAWLKKQPYYLQSEYAKNRAEERKCLKWILQNKQWVEAAKEMKKNAHEDSATWDSMKLSQRTSRTEIDRDVHRIMSTTSYRMKQIDDELLDEKRRKAADTARKVSNPFVFFSMMKRWQKAHITSAKTLLKGKSQQGPELTLVRSSQRFLTSLTDSVADTGELSSGSSIYCRYTENSHASSSSSDISSVPDLPDLPELPKDRRVDRIQRRYERMRAARMIQEAVCRGEFQDEEGGIKIGSSKRWKNLGIKPNVEKGKRRCNRHTLVPQVWQEEQYNCQVFYDPELYAVCGKKKKKKRHSHRGHSKEHSHDLLISRSQEVDDPDKQIDTDDKKLDDTPTFKRNDSVTMAKWLDNFTMHARTSDPDLIRAQQSAHQKLDRFPSLYDR